jgi:hypothetical protein
MFNVIRIIKYTDISNEHNRLCNCGYTKGKEINQEDSLKLKDDTTAYWSEKKFDLCHTFDITGHYPYREVWWRHMGQYLSNSRQP